MSPAAETNGAPFDGNAAAGDLAMVFAVDVTTAQTTCVECGDTRPIAELHAYTRAPGMVLRCAGCEAVHVRLVHGEGRVWLDLRGVSVLQMPGAPSA
jgi:hypothetical protein